MALNEKYYHTYCNSFGTTCRVSVLQEGFEGTAIELEAQPIPFVKKYKSASEFKFDPIRSSTGVCNFVFGTSNEVDFDEFWTADERDFKVEHYIDGNLDWVGWVVPNGFQYDFTGGVYYASITATDGLSTLESKPFSLNGVPYGIQTDLTYNNGFEFPFILIATEILRKLELDLNTWTAIDVYEQNMTKTGDTRDADPLAVSFVNVKTYINDTKRNDIPYWKDVDEVMDCKEVLENLCYIFGAKVYQNGGVWRIKRINIDADYGTGATQRYWRKYNTAAVYLGYETVNKEVNIPCKSVSAAMIGDDHLISMDEVYKAFRMNYDYTFVREGDDPVNLIPNPTFADFVPTSPLAAPEGWVRWREGNKWFPKLKPYTMTSQDIEDTNGITTAIEMGTQAAGQNSNNTDPNAAIWAALKNSEEIQIEKGADLYFRTWAKYQAVEPLAYFYPVFRMTLETPNKTYYLRNNNQKVGAVYQLRYDWVEEPCFFYLNADKSLNWEASEGGQNKWYEFVFEIDPIPENGTLNFYIHGLGATRGLDSSNFPAFPVYFSITNVLPIGNQNAVLTLGKYIKTVRDEWQDYGGNRPRLRLTNVKLGRIPNEEEFAESQDFIYNNPNNDYSLQKDPITVLNGDLQDVNHISNIIVPSNDTEVKNFWNTIDNKFQPSSIGLITVKSIMSQYIKPFRILEGTLKAENLDFDTRITLEALPGIKFIMQSATFNERKNYVDGVFVEISNEDIENGGTEGGNDLNAILTYYGIYRCRKDEDGLNTGRIEFQYTDTNPSSPTYNQTNWISGTVDDLDTCPIGEPSPYYWGTEDNDLQVDELTDYTYTILETAPRDVQVPYTNPGGEYIYFLHLTTLGLVERVSTEAQSNVISDFQYLADVTINGYLYKVLRHNYVTADFEGLVITYTFNEDQIGVETTTGVSTTYYQIRECISSKIKYTTIEPVLASQTYFDTQGLRYYTWTNTGNIVSTTKPNGYIPTMQIIVGETGCP